MNAEKVDWNVVVAGFWNPAILTPAGQDANVKVEFNFHLQSTDPEKLTDWLEYPINEVEKTVSSIMEKVVQVPVGEIAK